MISLFEISIVRIDVDKILNHSVAEVVLFLKRGKQKCIKIIFHAIM